METFKMITLVAACISVVLSIFENILPNENLAKQMKLIFGLILLLCIVSPLTSSEISFDEIADNISAFENTTEVATVKTDSYLKSSIEENISREIGLKLTEQEINFEKIKTSINISENSGISISMLEIRAKDISQKQEITDIVKANLGEEVTIKITEVIM